MFSDALDRETAWLTTTGDTLPDLTELFQVIQARWPRTPAKMKTSLYVLRQPGTSFHLERFASIRTLPTTSFLLRLAWPLNDGTGSAETSQLAFEQAIDAVVTRILGLIEDKTHGGRFLSVAEDRAGVNVQYDDPAEGISRGLFTARVLYNGDDPELNN